MPKVKKQEATPELSFGDAYIDHRTGKTCKYLPLHPGQIELYNSEAKVILACGGIRSGKTVIGAVLLYREIERNGGKGTYLVIAPTFGVALSSTLEAWEKIVSHTPLQGKATRGINPFYKCGTGATIYFKSADSDIQGLTCQTVWIDEAGEVSSSVFHKAQERLTGNPNGRLILTTTPYPNKGDWLRSIVMAEADGGNPRYFYKSFPTLANPYARQDEQRIEEQKRLLPEWQFKMMYQGEFTRPAGLVYDFYDSDGNSCFVDIPPTGLPPASTYIGMIDWGGNDPTAVLIGLLDANDVLWIFSEFYKRNEDVIATLEKLTEWNRVFEKATGQKVARWYCDHRPELIKAMRRIGLNAKACKKGSDSITQGISMVQARIRRGGLKVITKSCPAINDEAMLYRYPSDEGQAIGNIPIDKNNHALDALRYGITSIDRNNQSLINRILAC